MRYFPQQALNFAFKDEIQKAFRVKKTASYGEKFSKVQKDFMEQLQQGFSDSTPKAGSDGLKKSAKRFIRAIELIYISQI